MTKDFLYLFEVQKKSDPKYRTTLSIVKSITL